MIILNKIQKVPMGEPSCHLYMDWEGNIKSSDKEGFEPDIRKLMSEVISEIANNGQNVTIARAYANKNFFEKLNSPGASFRSELLESGVEPVVAYAGKWNKNYADTFMATDIIDNSYADSNVGHVIIIADDGAFEHVVRKLRSRNIHVTVIGTAKCGYRFRESANTYIGLSQYKKALT